MPDEEKQATTAPTDPTSPEPAPEAEGDDEERKPVVPPVGRPNNPLSRPTDAVQRPGFRNPANSRTKAQRQAGDRKKKKR